MTFKMPTPDIRVDAFGDVQPTNRRRFVMGDFFTADQVRAAYEQGLNDAAQIATDFSDDYMRQARGGDNSGASDHKACAAVEIADEIRNLKDTTK